MSSPAAQIINVEDETNLEEKRSPIASESESEPSESEISNIKSNATLRVLIRSATYFAYDGFSVTSGYKELARIAKVLVELGVDEQLPPPRRHEMTLLRKSTEFLLAPAISSLCWFVLRRFQMLISLKQRSTRNEHWSILWAKAAWTVIYRIGRQAIIYRLFFRIGSLEYSLASALGIVCCFFRETLFKDFHRLRRWPEHFSMSQGSSALLRSLIYALSFTIPLHRLCPKLDHSPRRRGNIKKLIFAIILSRTHQLSQLQKLVSGAYVGSS